MTHRMPLRRPRRWSERRQEPGVRVRTVGYAGRLGNAAFTMTPRMKNSGRQGIDNRSHFETDSADALAGPHEIAEVEAFLLPSKASAITGIDVEIDGGRRAGINWVRTRDRLPAVNKRQPNLRRTGSYIR